MAEVEYLDLTDCFQDHEKEAKTIVDDLKEKNLYKPGLIFHAFEASKVNVLVQYGTNPKTKTRIRGVEEDRLNDISEPYCPIAEAYRKRKPAIAVYDGDQMDYNVGFFTAEFKNPKKKAEALLIVYILELPGHEGWM